MKKEEKKEINNVCPACGLVANYLTCLKKYGQPPKQKAFLVSTFHKGKCDYCGEETSITQVRDFFSPDFSLIDKIIKLNILR